MRDGLDVEDQLPCGVSGRCLIAVAPHRILEGYERSALSNIGIIAIGLTGNKHLSIMNVNGDGFVRN
jgi:hypothetical protein